LLGIDATQQNGHISVREWLAKPRANQDDHDSRFALVARRPLGDDSTLSVLADL
jgi:hypothetical protein